MKKYLKDWNGKWSVGRLLFLIAGAVALISVVLGVLVSPYFFLFTGLVGIMQIIFALTGFCPMMIILKKCGVECASGACKK